MMTHTVGMPSLAAADVKEAKRRQLVRMGSLALVARVTSLELPCLRPPALEQLTLIRVGTVTNTMCSPRTTHQGSSCPPALPTLHWQRSAFSA